MATSVNDRHDGHSTLPAPSNVLSPRKPLSPAAQRALAEADARRAEAARQAALETRPKELHGGKGPEPTRYGDWENKGIATDF